MNADEMNLLTERILGAVFEVSITLCVGGPLRTGYTDSVPVREPLLAPLAAIAAGIVSSRFVGFEPRELIAGLAEFLILSLICLWRELRLLAIVCALLATLTGGALTDVLHR